MSSPRLALVGCGRWGRNIARNLAAMGVLRLICDSDEARGPADAETFGAAFEPDVDLVLRDGAFDAVVIATPAVTHGALIGAALQAGKHVFVEKPIYLGCWRGKAGRAPRTGAWPGPDDRSPSILSSRLRPPSGNRPHGGTGPDPVHLREPPQSGTGSDRGKRDVEPGAA